ncbi:MAG: valine--tRNA ligase [Candidatus Moraniibacteriota bacterium]|nr:MAG: valine--tRNA ligase [Candidatus Moranbacteria bacterium]
MDGSEFAKTYDPKNWEVDILTRWDAAGLANPDTCIRAGVTKPDAEPFTIVLPPPNVTGTLHIGHAAMLAIEDTIVRYKRMSGYRTLWLPGTDHAAIATESKVEKILRETEGKSRHDLGREEFLKRVAQFAQDSHDTIVGQVKRMGSSVDWSREAYTLDDARSLAVRTAFKRMYDAGIIYRGNRIVNWDPVGQTTISDDEVVYKEETAKLYYLKYGPFEIATARPETKFGDKYVVMHPEDARYAEYADGQKISLEWINGPIEATIVKDATIDMEFGTGVMTITPWHSTIDFELAERHGLDMEPIIDLSGRLLPVAGEFAGLPITEAREKIIAKLHTKGLVTKIEEPYVHQVATAERTGAVIEPQIMRQWFIGVNREFERSGKTVTLKSIMQDAVRSKRITILPERFEKTYFHWIDNLRDWCISRQIWFGHRIPVWYRGNETYCGIEAPSGDGWQQDPDSLDTWFSSGLWTFSTLGWPDESAPDFRAYHPTALLETGYDILFPWVARMILMSGFLLDEIPFRTVYLHGLVRDEQGRKMSKSLGNTVNPLDVAEQYGADALRLALIMGSSPGNDVKVGDEKFTAMRNFVNKLWNMGRYVSSSSQNAPVPEAIHVNNPHLSIADHWVLYRLSATTALVTSHLDRYNLSLAAEILRDFTWNEFADWYVEIHKIEKNDIVLRFVFDTLLRLWHPFTPFITEALRASVFSNEKLLEGTAWPNIKNIPTDQEAKEQFGTVVELVTRIRNIRATYHIDPKEMLSLTIVADESTITPLVPIIERLGRISEVLVTDASSARPSASASIVAGTLRAFVHLGDVIDVAAEKIRLEKETAELSKYIAGLKARLADTRFTERAPEHIIAGQRQSLADAEAKLVSLTGSIQELSS